MVAKFAKLTGFPIDKDKSKATGKLIKAYTKDGKQWGTLEYKIDLFVAGTERGSTLSGNLTLTTTMDVVVDGSATEGAMKNKISGSVEAKNQALTVGFTIDADGVETRTPVK